MSEDIHTLNERRCRLQQQLLWRGSMNSPTEPEAKLRSDMEYKLLMDACQKAEAEYRAVLDGYSAKDLEALTTASPPTSSEEAKPTRGILQAQQQPDT